MLGLVGCTSGWIDHHASQSDNVLSLTDRAEANAVPFLGANHKTGSRMISDVAKAVCAAGANKKSFVRAESFSVPTGRSKLCMTLTRCVLCHEQPGPDIEELVQPANHTSTLTVPPLYLLPELRGVIVLRDPINLVVSHYFYHLDGHALGCTSGSVWLAWRPRLAWASSGLPEPGAGLPPSPSEAL